MNEMLGTKIGAATIFSSLIDTNNKVRIVIDRDVLKETYYGCSDGTTTGYMKIKIDDIINNCFLIQIIRKQLLKCNSNYNLMVCSYKSDNIHKVAL